MVPLEPFRSPVMLIATAIGFAFMVGFYGLPFLFSLYFQQHNLSALGAGIAFVPMMLLSACLPPFSARIAERTGPRVPVIAGLVLIAAGSVVLAVVPASAPVWLTAPASAPVWLTALLLIRSVWRARWSCPRPPHCCWSTFPATGPGWPAACSTPAGKSAEPWPSRSSAPCCPARPGSGTACASASCWPPSWPSPPR
ncbi:MFS transporter [Streptomyces sp. NPDC005727]|uniref:MFS transporter n=1 Tax=unclassified Streptomyces TaxID=2593676 RepID=UPI003407022D